MRRAVIAIIAVVGAGALFAGGWYAAGAMTSPAQRDAAASPPPPRPITVEVTQGQLGEKVSLTVSFAPAQELSVQLTAPANPAIVTAALVQAGTQVAAGQPVVAINDQMVFALPGTFPLYRDLGRDDTGADVRMVQDALRGLGHEIPDRELGKFGWNTEKAVAALYKSAGATAPTRAAEQATTPQPPPAAGGEDPQAAQPAQPAPVAAPQRTYLPRSGVVILPHLPAVIASVPEVGSDELTLVVAQAGVGATSTVPAEVSVRLAPGMAVKVTGPDSAEVGASIASIGQPDPQQAAGEGGDGEAGAPPVPSTDATVVLTPDEGQAFADAWVGSTGIGLVTVAVVAQEALLVPTRAVAVDTSGNARVMVVKPDGVTEGVAVTELGTLKGVSAVAPVTPDHLKAGDLVVVDDQSSGG